MWRHQYIRGGVSSDLFSWKVTKPITMPEHGREKKKKNNRVRGDTRERVERNGSQLPTKNFWYLLFWNDVFLRISAELYS